MAEVKKLVGTESPLEVGQKINEIIKKGVGTGLQMFDTILKDHVLTYEESKGLALQGTYVYKDAIAGSRYGYPDFYNKVVEEYNESEVYYSPWTQPIATGETTPIAGGNMIITTSSAYSNYNAYKAMDGIDTGTTATTGWGTNNTSAVQWWQVKFPYKIRITGLTGYQRYDSTPANANTIGQFYTSSEKTTPIGDEYSNAVGVNWNAVSVTGIPAEGIVTDTIYFEKTGGGNHGGFGELKIEATYPTPFYKNANGHIFYNIADKTAIDDFFNTMGSAWFYGVDTENERVFLPRKNLLNLNPQSEIPIAGNGNSLGLMTVATLGTPLSNTNSQTFSLILDNGSSHNYEMFRIGGYNVPLSTAASGSTVAKPDNAPIGVTTDASASGLVADLSNCTVNNNEMLLYICVGNTEVQSSVTNVVDVTTTENDTMPLFAPMYFDFTPNNVSWLKGGEQKNSGGIYAFCYNELVNELTTPKYGLKVIETKDMIAGIDYSEYWKVNQDNMTFTTPTAISNKALSGAVVGNGMTLGVTDGTNNYALASNSSYKTLFAGGNNFGSNVGTATDAVTLASVTFGITTDPTKSGIIAEESTVQLYFKVANAVQNLELLDAGEVMEAVADKADVDLNNTVASQNFINQSVAWGMPDYSAGLKITLDTTGFVAPCDGIVVGWFNASGSTERNVLINDVNVGKSVNGGQASMFILGTGDVIRFSSGTSAGPEYFYPMKGVN